MNHDTESDENDRIGQMLGSMLNRLAVAKPGAHIVLKPNSNTLIYLSESGKQAKVSGSYTSSGGILFWVYLSSKSTSLDEANLKLIENLFISL